MPQPIYLATAFLFALAKFGVAGLLYSAASRLRGLSLLGAGFVALGLASIASMTLTRVVFSGALSGPTRGMVGLVSTVQIGLEFVGWAAMLGGAFMVAEALRTRMAAPMR